MQGTRSASHGVCFGHQGVGLPTLILGTGAPAHLRLPPPPPILIPRAVLAFFRARRLRTDGAAVLAAWRAAARRLKLQSRADAFRCTHLLVRGLGAWLLAAEETRMAAAAAHRGRAVARAVLRRGWPEGVARGRRKRELAAAAGRFADGRRAARGVAAWRLFAYYKRAAKVAAHWRVRRLGCLTLRHWRQVRAGRPVRASNHPRKWLGASQQHLHRLPCSKALQQGLAWPLDSKFSLTLLIKSPLFRPPPCSRRTGSMRRTSPTTPRPLRLAACCLAGRAPPARAAIAAARSPRRRRGRGACGRRGTPRRALASRRRRVRWSAACWGAPSTAGAGTRRCARAGGGALMRLLGPEHEKWGHERGSLPHTTPRARARARARPPAAARRPRGGVCPQAARRPPGAADGRADRAPPGARGARGGVHRVARPGAGPRCAPRPAIACSSPPSDGGLGRAVALRVRGF
jgi:hypothetical protein